MKPNSPPCQVRVSRFCVSVPLRFSSSAFSLFSLSLLMAGFQNLCVIPDLVRQPSASQIACGCWTCGQKTSECISKNSPECQKICHCQNVCQKMQAGVSENMSQNILDTCRKTCQKTCQNRQNYMLEYNKFQTISQRDCLFVRVCRVRPNNIWIIINQHVITSKSLYINSNYKRFKRLLPSNS